MEHYIAQEDLSKIKKVSALVGKTTQGLGRLLENLLNWALSQTGRIPYHPENIHVKDLLVETKEALSAQANEKQVNIQWEIEPVLQIYGDLASVQTIFRNLISNAIKYSNGGDTVTIKASANPKMVSMEVKDEGIGMSSEKLDEIFSLNVKSQQGTGGEKGSGLGLLLTKELVEMNKGHIEVSSQSGQGTTFTIQLPKVI